MGQVEEVFSGQAVVRAFNKEGDVLAQFKKTNAELYESAWKSQFLSGLMMPVMNFVSNLGYVAVAIAGALFAIGGRITVGDIQAFIQYVKNFTQPITQLAQVSNVLQQMAASAERVFAFLEAEEEPKTAVTAKTAEISGGVESTTCILATKLANPSSKISRQRFNVGKPLHWLGRPVLAKRLSSNC